MASRRASISSNEGREGPGRILPFPPPSDRCDRGQGGRAGRLSTVHAK